jgi:ABC-type transport system involved in Fe-S cluster assembly fused permease/ATPase subunit
MHRSPHEDPDMAIAGSPKKLAQDISEGYFAVTPPMLKKYTPADLKLLLANLGVVTRELRQLQIPLEDVQELKLRNMKISRANQAEMVIRAFCKKMRIPI